MATTIQISDNVQNVLQNMKLFQKESYNDIIERMIEDGFELNEKTAKEIAEAKARIRAGSFVTQDEVEKQLGI